MDRGNWFSSLRLLPGTGAAVALLLALPYPSHAGLFGHRRHRKPKVAVPAPAQVLGIVVEPLLDGLRLQIDCSSRVRFRWGTVENPRGLYVDLDGAQIARALRALSVGVGGVTEIQSDPRGPDQVRIYLGLCDGVKPRVERSDDGRSLTIRIKNPEPVASETVQLPAATPVQAQTQRLPRAPEPAPALPPPAAPTAAASLTGIDAENRSPAEAVVRLRVVGRLASWHSFRLDGPARLVVDLEGAQHRVPRLPDVAGTGLLLPGSIRSSQFSAEPPVTRVVIGLPAAPTRFSVDPPNAAGELCVRISKAASVSAEPAPPFVPAVRWKPFTVGIDPGHGGKDPGTLNPTLHVYEKNVTLDIALRLARLLGETGIRTVMTRRDDRHLEETQRIAFVSRSDVDAFVSIHCDAIDRRPGWTGITTYFHAQRANGRVLAAALQSRLPEATGLPDRGARSDMTRYRSGFYVLRTARMPAVLVECGYVSDRETARNMRRAEFRQQVAQGIADGLRKYWKEQAPRAVRAALPQ